MFSKKFNKNTKEKENNKTEKKHKNLKFKSFMLYVFIAFNLKKFLIRLRVVKMWFTLLLQ